MITNQTVLAEWSGREKVESKGCQEMQREERTAE